MIDTVAETRLRVLLVDDDPCILDLLEEVFREAGHEVARASSGPGALTEMHGQTFDVALVDYLIPPPHGVEILRSLRRAQPHCIRFLMSGNVDLPVALDAVNQGEVSRVLLKPFDPLGLLFEIQEAVSARRQFEAECVLNQDRRSRAERAALAGCLTGDCLWLALQPIVASVTHALVAYEALLRSRHPDLALADAVISAAERHGRLPEVARIVTERAAEILASLAPPTLLFINVHPLELMDTRGLEDRLRLLEPWADRVVFEITERSEATGGAVMAERVEELIRRGFRIAVDDLGNGFNALSVLANLKPHFIKVDSSIVRGVHQDPRRRRLASLLAAFGAGVGATVIAETVESPEEETVLTEAGFHLLQGFLFGPPARFALP